MIHMVMVIINTRYVFLYTSNSIKWSWFNVLNDPAFVFVEFGTCVFPLSTVVVTRNYRWSFSEQWEHYAVVRRGAGMVI